MTKTFFTARYDAVFKNALACEKEKDLLKEFLEKVLEIEAMGRILRYYND